MKLSIPAIYLGGIIAFLLLPQELWTLRDFISYMSSLSTVIMVFIYIFTTSQQLNAMRNQLAEMQYSRNIQSQPLLSFDDTKTRFVLPRYYVSPMTNFMQMELMCQIVTSADVTNIGNSPAVAIDFIPRIMSARGKMLVDTSLGERIECISLTEGDKQSIILVLHDKQNKTAEALLNENGVFLNLIAVYKNVLGMPFKQEIAFALQVPSEKVEENLRSCLKTTKTAEIDFSDQVREFTSLRKREKTEEAYEIVDETNAKLKKRFGDKEEIELRIIVVSGSFSVNPISQLEYQRLIAEKAEMQKKALAPLGKVPWFLK